MRHLYDIKQNRITLSFDGEYLVDGKPGDLGPDVVVLTEIICERPATADGDTADPSVVIDIGAGTLTRNWTVRAKTDAEAQKVASQLSIWKRLSAPERRALWNLADVDDTALLVLGAMWAAVETESRNPETKQLLGAALQLGIVADVARARVILDDPGFNLE